MDHGEFYPQQKRDNNLNEVQVQNQKNKIQSKETFFEKEHFF